ncbi:uncharacterized protein LOC134820224 [Bolinopsis microptera]|uniref:uncharacterized protein LOC134820224 n=1 Tax=Bolinopsis microptera TaxID=2820187 RepID=UPI00307946F9
MSVQENVGQTICNGALPNNEELPKREWKLGSFKEFTNEAGLRALFAEFLGIFMLVLFATGGINPRIIARLDDSGTTDLFNFSTSFGVGMTVCLMIYLCEDVSGGHVNPSITLMFFLDTQISFVRMICYIFVQFCGGFTAAGLLWGIGDFEGLPDFAPPTFEDFNVIRVIVFMVAGSWMMILVTLAAIDARRGHADCFLQPFAIGMSIHIALLFMGPYVVTGLNPIVICWYIVCGAWTHHLWAFGLLPFLGTATAVAVYNGILRPYKA